MWRALYQGAKRKIGTVTAKVASLDKLQIQSGFRYGSPQGGVMKRNAFGALMTLIVAIAIAAPIVKAQSQTIMKADVPFGFNVGSTHMPAGSYEIRALGARATVIETKDGHNRVLALFNPAGPSKAVDETKLVFQKYGDRYVLAQIWTSTSGQGLEAPKSDLEKESKLASNETQGSGETVIVALR